MDYGYKTHFDFAKDLLEFSQNINAEDSKIAHRAICSRLYYALFHKVLHDNPSLTQIKDRSLHSHIATHITAGHFRSKYCKLKALRQWADYDLENPKKIENINNLIRLYRDLILSEKKTIKVAT